MFKPVRTIQSVLIFFEGFHNANIWHKFIHQSFLISRSDSENTSGANSVTGEQFKTKPPTEDDFEVKIILWIIEYLDMLKIFDLMDEKLVIAGDVVYI